MNESRVKKSLLNARVSLLFYFLNLALSFVSRKLFLESLSVDFIGLTTTLNGFLSFLNLAELGVGSAIGYLLYKPIYDKNQGAICDIVSVFGYIYRVIGRFILGAGVVLSLFFTLIFAKSDISYSVIYFAFYCYLASSMLGYFINYRQILLSADQRNYLVSAYSQSAGIVCYILQMVLVHYTQSPYVWLAVNLLSASANCIILNWKINKIYPWLKTDIQSGRELMKRYPDIMTKTKQVFAHRIGTFAQYQITPSLVYIFESLSVVAYYGNYTIVVTKLTGLFSRFFDGVTAGVGNLIAEDNPANTIKVYWEMYTLDFFIAGLAVFGIYILIDPFITLWLGASYVMSNSVVILMLVVSFINITRGTTERFISGYGLYQDVWAPIVEVVICIVVSIVCGSKWGLIGVLIGNIVSLVSVVCLWKPYFLFRNGFKKNVISYWINWGLHIMCLLLSIIISQYLQSHIYIDPYHSYMDWIIYALICIAIFSSIYMTTLLVFTSGARSFSTRIFRYIFNVSSKIISNTSAEEL